MWFACKSTGDSTGGRAQNPLASSGKANDWRNREHVVLDFFSNLKKGKDPRIS